MSLRSAAARPRPSIIKSGPPRAVHGAGSPRSFFEWAAAAAGSFRRRQPRGNRGQSGFRQRRPAVPDASFLSGEHREPAWIYRCPPVAGPLPLKNPRVALVLLPLECYKPPETSNGAAQ
jgi:hypothetical protein